MSKKIEGRPVKVTEAAFSSLKEYSQLTGVPVAFIVREAISKWLERQSETKPIPNTIPLSSSIPKALSASA